MAANAEFTLNRNYTLISKSGYVVRFERGVPTFVPAALIPEVVGLGAERVDGKQDALVDDDDKKEPDAPVGEARENLVFEQFEKLVDRNRREDFTAQGVPHVKALREALGFDIQNKERDALWAKWHIKKGEEA